MGAAVLLMTHQTLGEGLDCLSIDDIPKQKLSRMDVTGDNDKEDFQYLPFTIPDSRLEVDGKCRDVKMRMELNGSESPVLSIEENRIVLTRPILHFFDGKSRGELIVMTTEGTKEVLYEESFEVWIASLVNLNPKFKDYERGQTLPAWEINREWIDAYRLPEIEDRNEFDTVFISAWATETTSQALRKCDCISVDQETKEIKIELPQDYSELTDIISVRLDDGKDINEYLLEITTKAWLIDSVIDTIEVYCRWGFLAALLLSVLAGLPA